MNERPIWRPNVLSPEEWSRLSREEQIQWWKAHSPPPGPAPHPLEVAEWYEQGIITELEISSFVFIRLTRENVDEFFDGFPTELLDEVRRRADRLPAESDDAAWSRLVKIESGCYAPWVSDEEIRQIADERERAFRRGLQIFREFAANRQLDAERGP